MSSRRYPGCPLDCTSDVIDPYGGYRDSPEGQGKVQTGKEDEEMKKTRENEDRTEIKDDRGFKLCEFVKSGDNEYLEFKLGKRFDTLQLDSLYEQIGIAYMAKVNQ